MATWKRLVFEGDKLSSLTGGNNKVFYSNASGAIVELPLGAVETVLTSNGPAGAPGWKSPVEYTHPTGDGSLHVPATSDANNGKVLTAGPTAGSLSWTTPKAGTITDIGTSDGILGGPITASGIISHSQSAGYKHIPANGANDNVLIYGGSSGTASWARLVGSQIMKSLTAALNETGLVGDLGMYAGNMYVCTAV